MARSYESQRRVYRLNPVGADFVRDPHGTGFIADEVRSYEKQFRADVRWA